MVFLDICKEKVIRITQKITLIKFFLKYLKTMINKEQLIINPPYDISFHNQILTNINCILYSAISLAITKIKNEMIEGSFAELGVYRGDTSKLINMLDPERKFYLFDTFQGFPSIHLNFKKDNRFKETNIDIVKKKIRNLENIIIKKGIFPETAKNLGDEKFSFVLIDFDLYIPTLKGLEFFYPRMSKGGYIFIHDYNNPGESKHGVFKAVNKFMKNKLEKIIEIPDRYGTVVFRKI